MSGTVTVTQVGSPDTGMRGCLQVVTGQASSPVGVSNSVSNTTPSLLLNGITAGSLVYGSNLGLSGTYTPNGATSYLVDHNGPSGLEYISMRSPSAEAGGNVTYGGSASVNSIAIALLEILKGAGALAVDGSSPGDFGGSGTSAVSGSFTPPTGSLLVLTAQCNGAGGANTVAITDTLGGLTWTERRKENVAGNGYCGIWTALVPIPVVGNGMLLGMEI